MDFSTILENFNLATFGQIMFANVVLSGDNAVLIGLAAAGLPAAQRSRAILFGMLFATVLRIIFSIFAVYLLEVPGLLLIGGLLLLWIAYGFFKELRDEKHEEEDPEGHEDGAGGKSMMQALKQIVIADVSMSLDNVLAVAGAAHEHPNVLIFGLILSVALMGLAATLIAKLLKRYHWIAYVGLAVIFYVAGDMIWRGWAEIAPMVNGG